MRWNDVREGDPGMNEVNLTPVIDVSLVLVVILLLATPLAFESNFGVNRAQASAQESVEETTEPRIELAIVSEETVRINREEVSLDDFGERIGALLNGGGTRDVTVTCGDQVTHGTFVRVLDLTKLNGARDVAVAGS